MGTGRAIRPHEAHTAANALEARESIDIDPMLIVPDGVEIAEARLAAIGAHSHAAEADGRYLQIGVSQLPLLRGLSPVRRG
jgi:hypothetical protein